MQGIGDQQCHRVVRIGFKGPLDRDAGQRAVARLPRGEGQQCRRRRDEVGRQPPHEIDPQPLVSVMKLRIHPRPGIIAHPQIGERDAQPGDLIVVGQRAAAAVPRDRLLDRPAPGVCDRQKRVIARSRSIQVDQRSRSLHGPLDGLAHRPCRLGLRSDDTGQFGPVGTDGEPRRGKCGRRRVTGRVERLAFWWTAVRVYAEVGPVPLAFPPQHVLDVDARLQ